MNQDGQKVVLLIDDDEYILRAWNRTLCREVFVLQATTVEQAKDLFERHKEEIDIIVMDACLNDIGMPNTYKLTEYIRSQFLGPIIAASGDDVFRLEQCKHGCNHQSNKGSVPETVLKILNLT